MLAAVAVLAGVVAAGIAALALADAFLATGIPDPGPLTTLGLPFVRAVCEVAAVIAVGGGMFAAFLTPPQTSGVLDVAGYRALRLAAFSSAVAAVCAVLLVGLTISDVSGEPLADLLNPVDLWRVTALVDTASAWRWTALIALVVAVAARMALRWSAAPVIFAGSLLTLVPMGLTGHSSAGGSHDLATDSLLIHLFAGSLWAGGLLMLLAHGIRGGTHADLAARRFSTVALWCFITMAVSGTINAAVRIRPSDLFNTAYGWLVATKVVALVVLGLIGWWQRSVAVAALRSDPTADGLLIRLALIEAVVFGSTFGIAVGLGRTPPPPPTDLNPSAAEVALGYDLAAPPTVARILTDWRFDLIFGTAAIILAVLYLVAVLRLRRRGDRWPARRTGAWLLGCAVLLFATSSGAGRYQPAIFSAHLAGHLLLAVLTPILLVRGAPTTLAMSALPSAAPGEPPGPREWLSAVLHCASARFCTHPVVALLMFAGGFYLLYLGDIFDATAGQHAARVAMNAVFLATGYLLCWVVVGADPRPWATPVTGMFGTAVAAIGLLSLFGVLLMGMRDIVAGRFYRSLQLPWRSDFLADQHLGAVLVWTVCGVALVVVLVALVIRWRRPVEGGTSSSQKGFPQKGFPQNGFPQNGSPQQVLHPQR